MKWVAKWFRIIFLREGDPVYHCQIYKEQGCAHVDGFLCDFPKCSMLKEYLDEKDKP